jgi:hypothetical protein
MSRTGLKTAAKERRRSPRVPHVMDAWIASPTATDPDDRLEATCLNINRHGVGFVLNQPLPTSAFYVIRIGLGEQHMVSEVRILTCEQLPNGQYDIGAEFS